MNRIGLGLVLTREVLMDHPEAALMRMRRAYEKPGPEITPPPDKSQR